MASFVTPTAVLRYLNRNLGALLQKLELTNEEMMRVVFQESLLTYSKYFPYRYKVELNAKHSIGGGYDNLYKIPNEENMTILGVSRIWRSNMNQFGGSLLPISNDPFETQMLNDYMSMHITPPTFEFTAPDIVLIKPKIQQENDILIEIKTVHPEHLHTIPTSMRDQFLKLCLYDVLISIYPLRHRFNNLNTPYGTLDLFMDMVNDAENNRNQLLESWRGEILKQGNSKKIWVA